MVILIEVICDDVFATAELAGLTFPLVICDPPYGNIIPEKWDRADYPKWFDLCARHACQTATIAMWGGVGKVRNRPFLHFAATVETHRPEWQIKNWITWAKKRAYGVQDNYLFTREECLILTRGEPTFNIPLLETKRGYPGYDPAYPAKSEFYRRTNVWTDITEIMRGKIHPTQKPDSLYEILVATHTNAGDCILDPCAGSGTTGRAAERLGRDSVLVEISREYIAAAGML